MDEAVNLDAVLQGVEKDFKKVVQNFEKELAKVRTGRANLALLEGIKVEYYGVPTPLNQVAALAVPDARLITIRPWEKKLIPAIEKAIVSADVGLTPSNDGDIIRLPVPPLTTERRKELVKQIKKMCEEAKVALRNVRRDYKSKVDKAEGVSEDDQKRTLDRLDKLTDQYIKELEGLLAKKEKEIMEF
jgi:ribosome recycling factor